MYSNAKNTANYLAKSETLLYFVMPKNRLYRQCTYCNSHTASLLSRCHILRGDSLARKRRGLASFVIYIAKLSDLCQRILKVASRYKVSTLRLLHLYPKSRVLKIKSSITGNATGRGTSTGPDSPKFRKSTWSTSTDRSLAAISNSRATTFLSRLSMTKFIRRSLSAVLLSSSCPNIRERISMTLRRSQTTEET